MAGFLIACAIAAPIALLIAWAEGVFDRDPPSPRDKYRIRGEVNRRNEIEWNVEVLGAGISGGSHWYHLAGPFKDHQDACDYVSDRLKAERLLAIYQD